jgi:hypothetical protein
MKLHPAFGEGIDVRRLDVIRPVAADPVLPEVIDHDEEDIRLGDLRRLAMEHGRRKEESA